MPKEFQTKIYIRFKVMVVDIVERGEPLRGRRRFEVGDDKRVAAWERIYLTEGPEGLVNGEAVKKGRLQSAEQSKKICLSMRRLRAENAYPKTCAWF